MDTAWTFWGGLDCSKGDFETSEYRPVKCPASFVDIQRFHLVIQSAAANAEEFGR